MNTRFSILRFSAALDDDDDEEEVLELDVVVSDVKPLFFEAFRLLDDMTGDNCSKPRRKRINSSSLQRRVASLYDIICCV
jgi:hypothetical protein